MAFVEQLGVDRRFVQLAAIWHWYLPLCNYVIVYNFSLTPSLHSFNTFFSSQYFSLTWDRKIRRNGRQKSDKVMHPVSSRKQRQIT